MSSYRKTELYILCDRRDPEARDRLEREKAGWGNRATVERIDDHHDVLVVHAGGVREVVR